MYVKYSYSSFWRQLRSFVLCWFVCRYYGRPRRIYFNRIAARHEQKNRTIIIVIISSEEQELEKFFYFQKDLWCPSVLGLRRWYRFAVLYSDCKTLIAFDSYPRSMRLLTCKFMNKIWTKCLMLVRSSFFDCIWNEFPVFSECIGYYWRFY